MLYVLYNVSTNNIMSCNSFSGILIKKSQRNFLIVHTKSPILLWILQRQPTKQQNTFILQSGILQFIQLINKTFYQIEQWSIVHFFFGTNKAFSQYWCLFSNNSMKSFCDFMKNSTFCAQKCRHITLNKDKKLKTKG